MPVTSLIRRAALVGCVWRERMPTGAADEATSATVPNSRHLVQRPTHLSDVAPQAVHSYFVVDLATDGSVGHGCDSAEVQEAGGSAG